MLSFVLFLVAVLLVVVIIRLLSGKALKIIGGLILAAAVLIGAVAGGSAVYDIYEQDRNTQDLITFMQDVDKWGMSHSTKDEKGFYHIETKKIMDYANDLYNARSYGFVFINIPAYDSDTDDREFAMTLEKPLNGVKEIKVIYSQALPEWQVKEAVSKGFRGSFLAHIFTLDKSMFYSPSKGWIPNENH